MICTRKHDLKGFRTFLPFLFPFTRFSSTLFYQGCFSGKPNPFNGLDISAIATQINSTIQLVTSKSCTPKAEPCSRCSTTCPIARQPPESLEKLQSLPLTCASKSNPTHQSVNRARDNPAPASPSRVSTYPSMC